MECTCGRIKVQLNIHTHRLTIEFARKYAKLMESIKLPLIITRTATDGFVLISPRSPNTLALCNVAVEECSLLCRRTQRSIVVYASRVICFSKSFKFANTNAHTHVCHALHLWKRAGTATQRPLLCKSWPLPIVQCSCSYFFFPVQNRKVVFFSLFFYLALYRSLSIFCLSVNLVPCLLQVSTSILFRHTFAIPAKKYLQDNCIRTELNK